MAELAVTLLAASVATAGGVVGAVPVVKLMSLPYTVPSPSALARKW